MKSRKIKLMCICGLFTALTFVITAYLHIPTRSGYIHVGDAFIYLAAALLPWQYAIAVGAGGAFLADCLTGYAIWAPASVIIKALTALLFTYKGKRILCPRNLLALFPAALLCVGGYYLYESLIYSNFLSPLSGIPASIMQSASSSAIFVALGITIDKMNFKSKLGEF